MKSNKRIMTEIVIKVLVLVAPVLIDWGIYPAGPFVLITDLNCSEIIDCVNVVHHRVVTALNYKKVLANELCEASIDGLFIWFNGGAKGLTMLEYMDDFLNTGFVHEKKIISPPFIITEERLPKGAIHHPFYIFLDEIEGVSPVDLLPNYDEFAMVKREISRLDVSLTGNAKYLMAAMCFLSPKSMGTGFEPFYEELKNGIQELILLNEELKNTEGIPTLFLDCLYNPKFKYHVLNLEDVNELPEDYKNILFYKGSTLYMSKELFNKITQPLQKFWKAKVLLNVLTSKNYIIPSEEGDTLIKMNIKRSGGMYERKYMIRFDLDLLDRPGEEDFLSFALGGGK